MMKNKRTLVILTSSILTAAISVSLGATTYAYYEKTKVIKNSNSETVLVGTDQEHYRVVTYTVHAHPSSASLSVYMYDKAAKKVIKMEQVDEYRRQFRVDYLTKIGTFEYRYFIANSNNPDVDVICEKNNNAKYRSLSINSSSSSQDDNWVTQINFILGNFPSGNGSAKVHGKFDWNDGDFADYFMNYDSGTGKWKLSVDIPQYISSDGSFYDYKYRTEYNNVWENYPGNRNIHSTIGQVDCVAYAYYDLNDYWAY